MIDSNAKRRSMLSRRNMLADPHHVVVRGFGKGRCLGLFEPANNAGDLHQTVAQS
jgi:hypothetical protein